MNRRREIIKRPLCLIAGGFVLGETFVLLSLTTGLIIPALLAAGACFAWLSRLFKDRRSAGGIWLPVFLLFVLFGMGRAERWNSVWEVREEACDRLAGSFAELEGRLAAVEEIEDRVQLTVRAAVARPMGKGADEKSAARLSCVLVSWTRPEEDNQDFEAGMSLRIKGELEPFPEARNPGEFDYRKYCRAMGVECRMYGEEVEVTGGEPSPLLRLLSAIRDSAKRNLKRCADPEDAGIFSAAVLGDKTELDPELKDLYQRNGIAHLLAISGLHLSLIGLGVYRLLRKAGLGLGLAGAAGTAFIVCYGVMTGGSPSVVRAVAMMSAGFLASWLGRSYDLLSAAALALLLLAWKSPGLLAQGGVQLSFVAVFAVGAVLPVVRDFLGRERSWTAPAAATVSIQLATLPVVLYHFYEFPVYGVFLNLLVVPLMGGVVCSGIAAAAFGGLSAGLGTAAAGTGHYILTFYEWLCRRIEALPFHTVVMGRPSMGAMLAYYLILGAFLALAGKMAAERAQEKGREEEEKEGKKERRSEMKRGSRMERGTGAEHDEGKCDSPTALWRRLGLFAAFCALLLWILAPRPVKGLEVLFLDVGQGDGILLRTGRRAVLIDGGSTSEKKLGEYRLEPCLKSLGVSAIECAFISHGDSDHMSGVRYLLEEDRGISVESLMLSCQGREDEALAALDAMVCERGGVVEYIGAGDRFSFGELEITCLHPGPEDRPADRNEESEVLKADYGNCHILFTGDMSGEGEKKLMASLADSPETLSQIQILKTAHHGSRFSSGGEFLDALGVKWAVISYAEGNSYGHPHREAVERLEERGAAIYRTAESGAIWLKTDGRMVYFHGFLDGP